MKQVRCPACRRVHADPAPAFTCEGCGTRLRWAGEWTGFTSQLPLFDVGGAYQPELTPPDRPPADLLAAPETAAEPGQDDGARLVGTPTSTRFQEAVGIIMGCRLVGDGDVAPAIVDVLTGRSPEDLCELILCCASMTGWLLDDLDRVAEGAGSLRLQLWALAVANVLPEER